MKMAVIYHSKTGHTAEMASFIAEGMMSVPGVQARAFPIDRVDVDFAKESRVLVVGTPVYAAGMSGATKNWLENSAGKLQVAGKLVGAFATADYVYGGGDLAMQSILTHLMVLGGLAYSGGSSLGKPYIHLGPVSITDRRKTDLDLFRLYGARMAQKAVELFEK